MYLALLCNLVLSLSLKPSILHSKFQLFELKRTFPEAASSRRSQVRLFQTKPEGFVPLDIQFEPDQIDVLRFLGKIDMMLDKETLESMKEAQRRGDSRDFKQWNSLSEPGRYTSIRVFEAVIPGGTRCFLKEFLPIGAVYGKNERQVCRKLAQKWNDQETPRQQSFGSVPPFPVLLGALRTDERVKNEAFRKSWAAKFPGVSAPQSGNIWLIFKWDKGTFQALRRFPAIPQVIDPMNYFRKSKRIENRWRFVRKIMLSSLRALSFLHSTGQSHGSISSDSIWMTTTDQAQLGELSMKLTDLGNSQKFSDLGPSARSAAYEDIYQLAFVFLEQIFATFTEDTSGANQVRSRLVENSENRSIIERIKDKAKPVDLSSFSQSEFQSLFESFCGNDFAKFREVCRETRGWEDTCGVMEADNGAAWRLIFRMLARGTLYETDGTTKMKISCRRLVRGAKGLFEDVAVNVSD